MFNSVQGGGCLTEANDTSAAAGGCRKSGEEWTIEDLLKLGHRNEQASCGSQLLLSL
jgi:hypothetical protein